MSDGSAWMHFSVRRRVFAPPIVGWRVSSSLDDRFHSCGLRGTQASHRDASALRHLDGTGSATHLGRFTLSADFTVITATGNATGTAIWTAANGDQLRVSVVGHGDIVVFPTVTITETHTITGGTGRFADASGAITIERSVNILSGVSSGHSAARLNLATR